MALAASTEDDAKISSKYFKWEVKGIASDCPGITSVDSGRLTVTVEEATQGDRPEDRIYTYGSHEYDDMTFVVQPGDDPESKELAEWINSMKQWLQKTEDGDFSLITPYKNGTLYLHFFGCLPQDPSNASDNLSLQFSCTPTQVEVEYTDDQ